MGVMRLLLGAFVVVLGSAACSKPSAPDAGVPAPKLTQADLFNQDLQALKSVKSFEEQLRIEAGNRPDGTVRVEQLIDAMNDAGVSIPAAQQFLGRTVLARYCGGAMSDAGLGVSVCEYGSVEKAARGRTFADQTFAQVKHREVAVSRTSVLTTIAPTAETQVQAAAVKQLFEKLEPVGVPPAGGAAEPK